MCGIVGAIAERDVVPILLEGLRRLEYRGYDSAGVAVVSTEQALQLRRTVGKVQKLNSAIVDDPLMGRVGIAHTRWATHGAPTEANAHPHISHDDIAIVHNGIIENHNQFRAQLLAAGYTFYSETDTEVVVHLLHFYLVQERDFMKAVRKVCAQLEGAFALGFIYRKAPERLIAVRRGCPLVIGIGIGEHFIASDHLALLPVTQQFVFLEEGDIAEVSREGYVVYDAEGENVDRKIHVSTMNTDNAERGHYRHFMQKEIFEQPKAVAATLHDRLGKDHVLLEAFTGSAAKIFPDVKQVHIVACGTSYHAGLVARYWLESLAGIACQVEIASEFRYRQPVIAPGTLLVTLSQSGETADTLAALRIAKTLGFVGTLTICNVAESALVRESDFALLTEAGREIGVASTKGFTTQLVAALLLTMALGKYHTLTPKAEQALIKELKNLPKALEHILTLDASIKKLAKTFVDKQHVLFLGRGVQYPIALEGALKLKELSYIHAEAYPAGELKHGPLALVDSEMPVIVIAPNDALLEKLSSNVQEVSARGGQLFVFTDMGAKFKSGPGMTIIEMPVATKMLAPILYALPLQLLAYHVAVLKGTDVDQPRNLAKSVTVE